MHLLHCVGICGLVGRATTFIGGDVGLIPTGSALDSASRCGSGPSGPEQFGWLINQLGNPSFGTALRSDSSPTIDCSYILVVEAPGWTQLEGDITAWQRPLDECNLIGVAPKLAKTDISVLQFQIACINYWQIQASLRPRTSVMPSLCQDAELSNRAVKDKVRVVLVIPTSIDVDSGRRHTRPS